MAKEREGFCNECGKVTLQKKVLYIPDCPEEGFVWECTICLDFIQ